MSNTLFSFADWGYSHFSVFSELRKFISSSGLDCVVFLSVSWKGFCVILTPQHIRKSTVVPTSNKPKKTYPRSLDFIWDLVSLPLWRSDLPRHCNFQKEVHETEKCWTTANPKWLKVFSIISSERRLLPRHQLCEETAFLWLQVWILYSFLAGDSRVSHFGSLGLCRL